MPDHWDTNPDNLFNPPDEQPDPAPNGHDHTNEIKLKDDRGRLRLPARSCRPGGGVAPKAGFEPTTYRLRVGRFASTWTAPDGASLLMSDALSVQTAPDGSRPIVGMIIGMIKAHPTEHRRQGKLVHGGLRDLQTASIA